MSKKSINSNKQFMVGNGILAFGVFFIVCLFLYLGFRGQKKEGGVPQVYPDVYTIQVAGSFAGDSLSIYVNDSLLLNRTLTTASVKLQINRFAEENALLVVDNRNDEITPFNLNPKGSSVLIEKRNGKIYIEETESTRN